MRISPLCLLGSLILSLCQLHSTIGAADDSDQERPQYVFIGVSGGLQDGFPDHDKMDFHGSSSDGHAEEEVVPAIYVGRALVRGTKSYLDVMQDGWRQYVPRDSSSSAQPLINSVVMVSGCHEHANQYWIYAVDSRQFVTILNNEPRFLGITPDTAMVDLTSPETDHAVKHLAWHEIARQGANKTDTSRVAFPIVVVVWYHDSFVPSPVIKTMDDGTAVTNFPESLALWAGVNDADRIAGDGRDEEKEEEETEACRAEEAVLAAKKRYWDGIRKAIRHAEDHPLSRAEWQASGPPFQCQQPTRLGVGPETARINYPFARSELESIFGTDGYAIDFDKAEIRRRR